MTHSIRCETAENPPCKCRCDGSLHRIHTKDLNGGTFMNPKMGGKVAKYIKNLRGSQFKCSNGTQKNVLFVGYPHKGGIQDRRGKKWQMFVKCRFLISQKTAKDFDFITETNDKYVGYCREYKKNLENIEKCLIDVTTMTSI